MVRIFNFGVLAPVVGCGGVVFANGGNRNLDTNSRYRSCASFERFSFGKVLTCRFSKYIAASY